MMSALIHTDAPPLRADGSGALRVGESRVLLELVIRAFQDGATPEAILSRYPSTTLADIYAVIAYYLRHRDDVESYLAERERVAELVRGRSEGGADLGELRERIQRRRTA
jgi:uncharacterized protein (DUF433 family)